MAGVGDLKLSMRLTELGIENLQLFNTNIGLVFR